MHRMYGHVNASAMAYLSLLQVVAVNGLSHKVSVVQKDIALLERGHEVRYLGCNLAIADLFDAGAHNCTYPLA